MVKCLERLLEPWSEIHGNKGQLCLCELSSLTSLWPPREQEWCYETQGNNCYPIPFTLSLQQDIGSSHTSSSFSTQRKLDNIWLSHIKNKLSSLSLPRHAHILHKKRITKLINWNELNVEISLLVAIPYWENILNFW
jgi:hypothetical protein